jgi:hypothetical protein
MNKILIILSAVVAFPFAANQAIGFAEKCETYQARVTRENIENTEKIAALLTRAPTVRESNESDFEKPLGIARKQMEIHYPNPLQDPGLSHISLKAM